MAYIDLLNPEHPSFYFTFVEGKLISKNRRPISEVPLAKKIDTFLQYLNQNYSHKTITNFRWCARMVISTGPRGYLTFNQLLEKYQNRKNIRSYLMRVMAYDFYDLLPPSKRFDTRTKFYQLSLHNQQFVEEVIRCRLARNISPSTVNAEAGKMASFLLYLEDCGISDIHQIEERYIREYSIYSHVDYDTFYSIGTVLRSYAEINSDEKIFEIVRMFPPSRIRKRIYTPLLSSERAKLEAFLIGPNSPLSKRDRAIGLTLLYTGMRACDVKHLRKSDINLATQTIHFIQRKTGVHVNIPLRPVLSNALVEYIRSERKPDDSPLLFTSYKTQKNRLMSCNIFDITKRIFDLADIRLHGAKRGTHVLRHAVADTMLNTGIDIAVISSILGHSSPKTTFDYINVNVEQLRACALPITPFEIKSKLYEKQDLR